MKKHMAFISSLLRYVVIAVFLLGVPRLMAQPKVEVPIAVNEAFKKQYTGVENLTWKPKAKKTWLADFEMDGRSYTSRYTGEGQWLETEKKVKPKELPEAIRQAVSSEHTGWEIQRARYMTSPSDSHYVVFIENDQDEVLSLRFDESGKPIRKVQGD